jgi:hypothetical protein
MKLVAGEERFFAQDKVEVVSEYQRNRSGKTAITAMKSSKSEAGFIKSFSGKTSCSNSRGTGRTCESKATVRAKSYPLSCLSIIQESSDL